MNDFFCHLSEPTQAFLDGVKAENVEVVEDLSVDLGFLEHMIGDSAILTGISFNQIDDVVDATVLQSILLLFISSIHDRSCQVICCFSLDDEVKDVISVNICAQLHSFLLVYFWFVHNWTMESEYPQEIAKRQRFEFTPNSILLKSFVKIIAILNVSFLTVVYEEDQL